MIAIWEIGWDIKVTPITWEIRQLSKQNILFFISFTKALNTKCSSLLQEMGNRIFRLLYDNRYKLTRFSTKHFGLWKWIKSEIHLFYLWLVRIFITNQNYQHLPPFWQRNTSLVTWIWKIEYRPNMQFLIIWQSFFFFFKLMESTHV